MDSGRRPHNPSYTSSSHHIPMSNAIPPPTMPERSPSPSVRTSLPSIHHLHPDLPPATLPPHHMTSPHLHPQGTPYPASGSAGTSSALGVRPAPDDSDPDNDQPGPPKKKRRRQALSCTECKRRKIKCDRAQPCGPCSRRNEQNKCQWHIIEPMEKYVTRAEYDELKSRVDDLQSLISRLVQGAPHGVPPMLTSPPAAMPMSQGPILDPVHGTAITPYHQAPSTSAPGIYHTMIPPSRSPIRGDPPPLQPPITHHRSNPPIHAPRSPLESYRTHPSHPPPSGRTLPPVHTQGLSPRTSSPSPTSAASGSRLPPPAPRTTSTVPSRRSSLSLAAITSPFTPDTMPRHQSKNLPAQTLPWLGQRLRPLSDPSGSAPGILPPPLPTTLTSAVVP